jgi:hypothetical protein
MRTASLMSPADANARYYRAEFQCIHKFFSASGQCQGEKSVGSTIPATISWRGVDGVVASRPPRRAALSPPTAA